MNETFDYIIVGAGSAGCVMANRLSASGKHNVLLIEAGGDDKNFWIDVPAGMVKVMKNLNLVWPNMTRPTKNFADRSIPLLQGKTLGGSSSINGMLYVRGQREDYDGWSALGCTGWSWDDVLPYFKKSEKFHGKVSDEFHGRNGEMNITWVEDIDPCAESFIEAAQEYGMPLNPDVNSGSQDGIGYIMGTVYKGKRQSAAKAFLHPIRDRKNLTIKTNKIVRKVVFNEMRRAVGVELETANGQIETVKCNREVILSAGALGSPCILQHSGIGDGEHLKKFGIETLVPRPEVGRNLQDHLLGHLKFRTKSNHWSRNYMMSSNARMGLQALKWMATGRGAMTTTSSQITGFFKSNESISRCDLQLAMRPFSFTQNSEGEIVIDKFPAFTASAIQTRPYSRGDVLIKSNDPKDRGDVNPAYYDDDRDMEVMQGGIAEIRKIMQQPSVAHFVEEEVEPGPQCTGGEDLASYLRASSGTVYHPVGTCRMGVDADAVLDPSLRVRGVDGLRVIDASIMPVITSGNTNAPAIMIGEKGADMVLAGLNV